VQAGYRMWVDTPPSGAGTKYPGAYSGSTNVVFVWVERDEPSFFGQVMGLGNRTISAWASASNERQPQAALTALCGSDANDNSDCTGGNKAAVKVNTNNGIEILGGGDLVSDKSLIVTAGPGIALDSGTAYVVGASACGASTWSCPPSTTSGITDTGSPKKAIAAVELSPKLMDPAYAQPGWVNCTAPPNVTANCIPVRGTGALGDGSNYTPGSFSCNGNGANACGTGIPAGGTSGSGSSITCTSDSPRIAPGYYDTIRDQSGCIVLDATSPGTTTSYSSTTGLWDGQRPGIYRIRTSLNVQYLVGDAVTVFLDPGASLSVGGAIILNTGNTCGATNPGLVGWSGGGCNSTDFSRGAWGTAGTSPWDNCSTVSVVAPARCVSLASNYHAYASGSGLAIYVRPPTASDVSNGLVSNGQLSQKTSGSWTTSLFSISGSSFLYFLGTMYAPRDNVTVAGNPSQASSGTILAWTVTYSGTTQFVQTYAGAATPARPFLLEPTVGE
jgi:hypothetical protein